MMSMNFNNIAILNIHGVDYRCFIKGISKIKAITLSQKKKKKKKKMPIKVKKVDYYKI